MADPKKPKPFSPEDLEKTIPAGPPGAKGRGPKPPDPKGAETETVGPAEREVNEALERLLAQVDSEMKGTVEREFQASPAAGAMPSGLPQHRHLFFTLASTRYALPLANVLEIGTIPEMTPVPNLPEWVAGVTNLRGEILSVVDIRAFLGIGRCERLKDNRLVVLRTMDDAMQCAILVDQVNGIHVIAPERVRPPKAPVEASLQPFVEGIHDDDGRLIVVVNMDRLLKAPRVVRFRVQAHAEAPVDIAAIGRFGIDEKAGPLFPHLDPRRRGRCAGDLQDPMTVFGQLGMDLGISKGAS